MIEPASPPVCAVVLAAGEGRRLRPLTEVRQKALCPVANVPLVDHALGRLAGLGLTGPDQVAVNACYLADQVVEHVGTRAWLSVEPAPALGTAGAVGNLRDWIAGRGVLVGNADAYLAATLAPGADIAALLSGWDGQTVRILGVPAGPGQPAEFGRHLFAGFSLLPWSDVARLTPTLSHLVLTTWRPAEREGRLEVIEYQGCYLDTGTPANYLAANLHASMAGTGSLVAPHAVVEAPIERAVIGAGAHVAGRVTRSVVWPGGVVSAGEHLVDAIRVGKELTIPGSG